MKNDGHKNNTNKNVLLFQTEPGRYMPDNPNDPKIVDTCFNLQGLGEYFDKFNKSAVFVSSPYYPRYQKNLASFVNTTKNISDEFKVVVDLHGDEKALTFPSVRMRALLYNVSKADAKNIEIYFANCKGSTKCWPASEKNSDMMIDINKMAQNIFRGKGKNVSLYYMPEGYDTAVNFTTSGDMFFMNGEYKRGLLKIFDGDDMEMDLFKYKESNNPAIVVHWKNGKWTAETKKITNPPVLNGIYSKPPRKFVITDNEIKEESVNSLVFSPNKSNNNKASISGKQPTSTAQSI